MAFSASKNLEIIKRLITIEKSSPAMLYTMYSPEIVDAKIFLKIK